MKIRWKTLFVCILIPLAVGSLSALITRNGMEAFALVNKPALSPPNWLFPIVWTLLYTLMGFASYLIYTSKRPSQQALAAYGLQLIVNFFWSIFFFNLQWYLFSFIWLVLLWLLILYTIKQFYPISKPASYLLIPYLLWSHLQDISITLFIYGNHKHHTTNSPYFIYISSDNALVYDCCCQRGNI